MRNALTFDVEEYFQVEAFRALVRDSDWSRFESRVVPSTERLLNMLDARGVSATFFVVGWVARKHPSLVRTIQRRGHEIGCHSDAHRPIYSMDPETFRKDLVHAKQVIEDATGVQLFGYRAPTFSIVKS
ncbi:MAG TPA: polysaccharide deacetylase family protein, partial [Gemmatimonadaceae bacterium]